MTNPDRRGMVIEAVKHGCQSIPEALEFIQNRFNYGMRYNRFSYHQNRLLRERVIQKVLPSSAPPGIDPIVNGGNVYPAQVSSQGELIERIKDTKNDLRNAYSYDKLVKLYGYIDQLSKPAAVNVKRLARVVRLLVQVYGRPRVEEMLDTIETLGI